MQYDVSILGEKWMITITNTEADERLEDCDGFCDKTSRRIVIDDMSTCKNFQLDDKIAYVAQNIRHEIIHAFMFESGLQANWQHPDFGHEETVVDWFAAQYPKIKDVIETACTTFRDAYEIPFG